jgi:hypothetical protein
MKDVERRAALQGYARPDQRVRAKSIENIDQPDHTLQRRGLKLPLGRKVLKGFSRSGDHSDAFKSGVDSLRRQKHAPRLDEHGMTGFGA